MQKYKQLTQDQRYGISIMLKQGFNQTEIAKEIEVHKLTISREIMRNTGKRGYRHKQAHRLALERRSDKVYAQIECSTRKFIECLIREDWSPEQIQNWLKENMSISVSHEWIYQYIIKDKQQGGDLYTHLRCKRKRKKRYGSYNRIGQIKNRNSIDQRPDAVNERSRMADWEADTIIGKGHKQAIVSLTERKSGYALFMKVDHKSKVDVEKACNHLLYSIRNKVI